VNGQPQSLSCNPGSWASLDRKWKSGDKICIELPMEVSYAPIDSQHPKRVALVYGPAVLVKRKKPLSKESLAQFSKPEHKLNFQLQTNGAEDFVPFYSVGHREPYEMYFDLS
jgi:uncharacterized protein